MNTVTVNLPSPLRLSIDLTDEQFWQLCQRNRDYCFERNARGDLIVISPTGSDTGRRNLDIIVQLGNWNKQNKLGVAFDSSTGFKLPNGAERSPDASWVKKERWESLTSEEKERFAPICPDFVVELRLKSDALPALHEKMQEYIANNAKLGWLIDRQNQQVEIYRQGKAIEVIKSPQTLSGEDVLPGFILDLAEIL